MAHHQDEETNIDYLYYLVGLFTGLLMGVILGVGLLWTLAGGVVGLLCAAFFLKVFVKGRNEQA